MAMAQQHEAQLVQMLEKSCMQVRSPPQFSLFGRARACRTLTPALCFSLLFVVNE
jgi:hypothetical protein